MTSLAQRTGKRRNRIALARPEAAPAAMRVEPRATKDGFAKGRPVDQGLGVLDAQPAPAGKAASGDATELIVLLVQDERLYLPEQFMSLAE